MYYFRANGFPFYEGKSQMLMNKECYKGDADDEIIKCQVDDSVQIVKKNVQIA